MMLQKIIVTFLLCAFFAQAQNKIDLKLTNKIAVNRDTDYVYAYTLPEPSTFAANEEVWYHWYSGGTIKVTRGGYDGKLLDGKFSCFYHNKNLEEQGLFKKGSKTGKWKSWYPSGELKSISHWKRGRQVRRSYHYNEQHQLVRVYKYRKGQAILKHPKPANPKKKKVLKDSTAQKTPKKRWSLKNIFKKKADRQAKVKTSKTPVVLGENGKVLPEKQKKMKKPKKPSSEKEQTPKVKQQEGNLPPSAPAPIPIQKDTIQR